MRGDLLAAMSGEPETMVLLDGYFFGELSVPHKELLYVLDAGVNVVGAASMGALRAAEMHRFGMVGVGTVYDWYDRGIIDGDDEVAVLHLPHDLGYKAVTIALVEVRIALASLTQQGIIGSEEHDTVLAAVKELPFIERTPSRISTIAAEHLREAGRSALRLLLDSCGIKERDAIQGLDRAREPIEVKARMQRPTVFVRHWCEDFMQPPSALGQLNATYRQGWNVCQLFHDEVPHFLAELRLRQLAATAAERAGLTPLSSRIESIEAALQYECEARHGCRLLPAREIREEALIQALAGVAVDAFGSREHAGDWLAAKYGLRPSDGHRALMELHASQFGLLTIWAQVRAFTVSTALVPSLELARAVNEVHEPFQRWSGGGRISSDDLIEVAAEIWSCTADEVPAARAGRGLLPSHGFSYGFAEVLQWVAAAERLPRPVNDYAAKKSELRFTPLRYPVTLPLGEVEYR